MTDLRGVSVAELRKAKTAWHQGAMLHRMRIGGSVFDRISELIDEIERLRRLERPDQQPAEHKPEQEPKE